MTLRFALGLSRDASTDHIYEAEARRWGDIAFVNGSDAYERTAEKVVAMLSYAAEHFPQHMLVKMDDDVWVNGPALLRSLDRLPETGVYAGSILRGALILRQNSVENHSNAEPPSVLPGETNYPPFASGCFVMMSPDVVQKVLHPPAALVAATGASPAMTTNDDAMIGILLHAQNVSAVDYLGVYRGGVLSEWGCQPTSTAVAVHYSSFSCWEIMERAARVDGRICNTTMPCCGQCSEEEGTVQDERIQRQSTAHSLGLPPPVFVPPHVLVLIESAVRGVYRPMARSLWIPPLLRLSNESHSRGW